MITLWIDIKKNEEKFFLKAFDEYDLFLNYKKLNMTLLNVVVCPESHCSRHFKPVNNVRACV